MHVSYNRLQFRPSERRDISFTYVTSVSVRYGRPLNLTNSGTVDYLYTSGAKTPSIMAPVCRYMYWTDWGEVAKIEKAGMDGQGRTVIIDTELIWPNGLALDYDTQILYWADANLDKIEYASIDGSGRTLLETGETGLLHPYALTIHGDLLYWTDWQNNSVFATHKINGVGVGGDIASIVSYLVVNPNGIEAVGPNKQPSGKKHLVFISCTSFPAVVELFPFAS